MDAEDFWSGLFGLVGLAFIVAHLAMYVNYGELHPCKAAVRYVVAEKCRIEGGKMGGAACHVAMELASNEEEGDAVITGLAHSLSDEMSVLACYKLGVFGDKAQVRTIFDPKAWKKWARHFK